MTFFGRLISHLYRRPNELDSMITKSALRGRWLIFIAMTMVLVVPLFISLFLNIVQWTDFAAEVSLPRSQWTVLYEQTPGPCGADASLTPDCLGNPSNPSLWASLITRADQQAHKARVFAREGKEYWVGVSLTPEQMRNAFNAQANFLVLGEIVGSYRIWVNGKQLMTGERHDTEPIALQIPLTWFAENQPVRLAMWIVRTTDMNDAPDLLEDAQRLGLTTKAGTTNWKRYYNFWFNSRPLVFLALNFLLGWLFFAIWSVAPEKTEYFYIAVLAMTFALFQMRYVELYYMTMNRQFVNSLGLSMAILYAFAGMLAGLSFARFRPLILKWAFWLCIGLCLSQPFLVSTIRMPIHAHYWMGSIADVTTFLGALACYLQAFYLYQNPEDRLRLRLRLRRLLMFGTGLLFMIVLNQVSFAGGAPTFLKMFLGKSGPFFLLLSLGLIALSEYRSQTALAKGMPISKFHRLIPLPDFVRGAILNVDLKGSEKISRQGAKLGKAGDLLETCLSHMWMAVSQNGGIVLQTEGDALRAIFPAGELEAPVEAAFRAVDTMRRNLMELEQRFVAQGMADMVPKSGIHFRGAIVLGEIRPIWQSYGGARLASWAETGHSNVLIEVSRLLEMEREVAPGDGKSSSIVIVPQELKKNTPTMSLMGQWLFESRTLLGKHGTPYEVAAYQVNEMDLAPFES
ncbi:MAG: hypothetical protein A2X86_11810 [Bdellovibrionales bacterium GWA2_49_15]|nr:MAG: hypothetical protein A2X86_11810 [Bdellovibrionales bacterium GWA2_49_15]HAZ12563.1 hypothetical protein [Bdellovibrionales bacterium]